MTDLALRHGLVDTTAYASPDDIDRLAAELDEHHATLATTVHHAHAAARRIYPPHSAQVRQAMTLRQAVDAYLALTPAERRLVDQAVRLAEHRARVGEARELLAGGWVDPREAARVVDDLEDGSCPLFRQLTAQIARSDPR